MKTLEHYLLSMPAGDGSHVHAYLITADPDGVLRATNRMMDEIDFGHRLALPVCFQTVLSESGAKQIRAFLAANFPEARKLLKAATDFHFTSWGMPDDHPDSDWLLKLH